MDWSSLPTAAHKVAANTLSGAVSRSGSSHQLFLLDKGSAASNLWLSQIQARPAAFVVHRELETDFSGLLCRFSSSLSGFALGDDSSIAEGTRSAVTAAAALGAVVLSPSTLSLANGTSLVQLVDARSISAADAWARYGSLVSLRVAVHQEDLTMLSDFAVFAKAFTFYDDALESDLAISVLKKMGLVSAVLGWAKDEFKQVRSVSRLSKFVTAADHALNLALFTNMANDNAHLPTPASQGLTADRVHRVAFVMSDGDNVQWLLNDFATSEKWFGSPNRGKVPIGWTISPAMLELAPLVVEYIANASTPNDDFVAGPSGLGYILPDDFPEPDRALYAETTAEYMQKLGLRSTLLLGEEFSLGACAPLLGNATMPNEGAFWMNFADYAGLQGAIHWVGAKPIVGPRWILAEGMGPHSIKPAELAKHLNSASRDPEEASSYSVVIVHVWTMGVDDVLSVASALDGSHVRIVSPTEMLRTIAKNVPHK